MVKDKCQFKLEGERREREREREREGGESRNGYSVKLSFAKLSVRGGLEVEYSTMFKNS